MSRFHTSSRGQARLLLSAVRLRADLTLDTSFTPILDGDITDIVELPPGTP